MRERKAYEKLIPDTNRLSPLLWSIFLFLILYLVFFDFYLNLQGRIPKRRCDGQQVSSRFHGWESSVFSSQQIHSYSHMANEEVDGVRKEKERLTTDHQPLLFLIHFHSLLPWYWFEINRRQLPSKRILSLVIIGWFAI